MLPFRQYSYGSTYYLAIQHLYTDMSAHSYAKETTADYSTFNLDVVRLFSCLALTCSGGSLVVSCLCKESCASDFSID